MSNVEEFSRYGKRVFQMLWDPVTRYDDSSPIWCLGRCYDSEAEPVQLPEHPHGSPPESTGSHASQSSSYVGIDSDVRELTDDEQARRRELQKPPVEDEGGWPASFLDDFESRIWLTYRQNFQTIAKSQNPKASASMSLAVRLKSLNQGGFTSDTGWGCMIRSGQSLLANTMLVLELGRDWRRGKEPEKERCLLSLFADDPKAPFSIHNFVAYGAQACGKHPGEWFGPSAAARSIKSLTNNYDDSALRVYITDDKPDVYEDSFMRIAKSPTGEFRPTLLLVSTRLGLDRVTPLYWEALKNTLQLPQSMGIAGGRPAASHYFVGTQSQYFFYLDPHTTRPFLPLHSDPAAYSEEDIDSCHTRRIRRLHIKDMDPSMLIAFLIRDEEDWRNWRHQMACVQGKPIVHVADKEPPVPGQTVERAEAIDEVETFDDTDDEGLQ